MSSPGTELPRERMDGSTSWRRRPELGNQTLLGLMAALSLRLGRPFGRTLLHAVGAYYFVFAPTARAPMREYLRRALGREPRARDRLRQIMSFATTIQDRLYLLAGRYPLFDVTVQGEEVMRAALASGGGAFLMGAHMGSFEVLRVVGRRQSGLSIAMAMYEDNARKLNAILAAAAPTDPPEIIPIGRLDSMLRIQARLEQGGLVGVLADRLFGDEPSLPVNFLGAIAHFPTGPMRVAAILRRPVVFMLGLYRGGNRYHLVFESLADFSATPAAERQAAIEAAIRRYAAALERYCRSDPYNWCNFFGFWGDHATGGSPQTPAVQPR